MSADLVKAPSRWLEPAKEPVWCECHESKLAVWPDGDGCRMHGAAKVEAVGRFVGVARHKAPEWADWSRHIEGNRCAACAEHMIRNLDPNYVWEIWEI